MLNWLRKLGGSSKQAIHPPWQAGQYVTYFLERADGGWAAFALRLLGQADDKAWVISGDFKTPFGESMIWFRCDPAVSSDSPDIMPVKHELVRRASEQEGMEPVNETTEGAPAVVSLDPMHMGHLAMNLLMVRRWPEAVETLRRPARDVRYPCEIDRVHLLVMAGPGYERHHDLNPRVMLTGVARLAVDGDKNPMTATSFGRNDPNASGPYSNDDFVDLSHAKCVEHEGFSLTYPATWFLRRQPEEEQRGPERQDYFAQVGGMSWAATLGLSLFRGNADQLARERDAILARSGGPLDGPVGRLVPRPGEPSQPRNDARQFAFDLESDGIDGFMHSVMCCSELGDRLAHVRTFGCISKDNPRRAMALAEMEPVFRAILASFRFA